MALFTREGQEVIKENPITNIVDEFRGSIPGDGSQGTYFKTEVPADF